MTAIAFVVTDDYSIIVADCYNIDYLTENVDYEHPVNKIKEYNFKGIHNFFAVMGQAELSDNFPYYVNEKIGENKEINWRNSDALTDYLNYCNDKMRRKNKAKTDKGKEAHIIKNDNASFLFLLYEHVCIVRRIIYQNAEIGFIIDNTEDGTTKSINNEARIILPKLWDTKNIEGINKDDIFELLKKELIEANFNNRRLDYDFRDKFTFGMFYFDNNLNRFESAINDL